MKLPLPRELRVGEVDLIHAGKRLIKEIGEDDISGAAAELAYRIFLAIFPFFIFLAALGGFAADAFDLKDPTQEIMNLVEESLPPDAASVLRRELENVIGSRDATLLSIGIVGAIWSASSGVGTIAKTMNQIYEVRETRPRWRRYLLSLGLTFLGGGFLIAAFVVVVAGQFYALELADVIGIEGPAATAFSLARWPAVVLALLASLAILYWAAPDIDLPIKWISPGAVFASIGWLLMTLLFGLYVANLGSYNATYGTLGGVVIMLVWLFLSSFVLLLGAEINSVLAQEAVPEMLPPESTATFSDAVRSLEQSEASGEVRRPSPGARSFALLTGFLLAMLAFARLSKR